MKKTQGEIILDGGEQEAPVERAPRKSESGWQRTLLALRQRNFRLYWSGQVLSFVGTSMQSIGQAWLVLKLSQHSAWQLGLVGALQALPILLFSLFGGVLADRWPKRNVLLVTQAAALLQAALLWVLSGTNMLQLWHLYVLALVLGLTNSLGRPASRSFVVELVGREDLPNAVALNSSISTLALVLGPALGGVIIAASNGSTLFLLNALSFVPVIISLALIDSRRLYAQAERSAGARQKTWQSLSEGMGYVWRTPAVLLIIVVVGLVLLFGSNFGVILLLFATDILRAGATGYGFLSAASGLGALFSALWLAWSNRKPTLSSVLWLMLAFSVLEAVFAFTRFYPLSLGLIAAISLAEMAFAAQAMTELQTVTPDHLRGRVMSVQVLFFDGSLPLGYLLIGWLSGLFGPASALLIGAGLCLLVVGGGWIWHSSVKKSLRE